MKKHIPNLITLGNLFCGTVAIIFAVEGALDWVALFVAIGIFLDFFDGFFASAYRLANFNIDTRQTSGFIGLPTPANTMFILSLPLIMQYQSTELFDSLLHNSWVLLGITLLSAYLLNAEIALFALKFSDYSFKNNALKYIFLALCVILLVSLKMIAIPIIILLYIILSLLPKR